MQIIPLTPTRFAEAFDGHAPFIYNKVAFAEHNRLKAESLHYLGFADGDRLRLGIVLGRRGDCLLSPFSAPFGGFVAAGSQAAEHYFEAAALLRDYSASLGVRTEIALPPELYAPDDIARQTAALSAAGRLMWTDICYARPLGFGPEGPQKLFTVKSRNQWRKAAAQPHTFEWSTDSPEIMRRAYAVIEANHRALGYPLHMSLEAVRSTAPLTGSVFCVLAMDGTDVAAAMINRPAPRIAQVIYWGDRLEYRSLCPMNLLAAESMKLMQAIGADLLDIGPSSERGVPAEGLCRFKEGLGCRACTKPRFEL